MLAWVLKLLKDKEWIEPTSFGIKLVAAKELLQNWSGNYSYKNNKVSQYFSLKSIPEIENDIASIYRSSNFKYAITGFSGAARFAPAVRYQRVMSYVEYIRPDLISKLGFKEVSSGANVVLMSPFDEGVYYGSNEIDGIRIVSPVQLYLDLKGIPGRGEEAAQALLYDILNMD